MLTRLHFSDRFETEQLWQFAISVILGQFGQFRLALGSLAVRTFEPRHFDVGRHFLHLFALFVLVRLTVFVGETRFVTRFVTFLSICSYSV